MIRMKNSWFHANSVFQLGRKFRKNSIHLFISVNFWWRFFAFFFTLISSSTRFEKNRASTFFTLVPKSEWCGEDSSADDDFFLCNRLYNWHEITEGHWDKSSFVWYFRWKIICLDHCSSPQVCAVDKGHNT